MWQSVWEVRRIEQAEGYIAQEQTLERPQPALAGQNPLRLQVACSPLLREAQELRLVLRQAAGQSPPCQLLHSRRASQEREPALRLAARQLRDSHSAVQEPQQVDQKIQPPQLRHSHWAEQELRRRAARGRP